MNQIPKTRKLKNRAAIFFIVTLGSVGSWGQKKYPYHFSGSPSSKSSNQDSSKFTYDIAASVGSHNGASFQEINLGLNWIMSSWLNWRNALFTRMSENTDTISGLDSSLRLQFTTVTDEGGFGVHVFAGPGVRLATQNWNAAFGEAGLIFRLGGIQIGGGIKNIQYFQDRTDKTNTPLPKNENQVFLILSGSGSL